MNVLQTWVSELSMMQQSVLLTAVRGPDGVAKYGPVKMLLRWYRRCILLSAMDGKVLDNPYSRNGGSFTGPSMAYAASPSINYKWEEWMDGLVGDYIKSLDAIPHHFQLHLLHAIEIIGYKHPDERIRMWWCRVYYRLVSDMHLYPENESDMDDRLGDNRAKWLERCDPATRE